jgi:hypothetical protein
MCDQRMSIDLRTSMASLSKLVRPRSSCRRIEVENMPPALDSSAKSLSPMALPSVPAFARVALSVLTPPAVCDSPDDENWVVRGVLLPGI